MERREYVLSGWWRRVGATVIDVLLLGLVATAGLWAFGFDFREFIEQDGSLFAPPGEGDILYVLAFAAASLLYFPPVMSAWDGRTVGKRASGIRVVRADGRPLGVGTIVLRQTVLQYLLFTVIPLAGLVDCLLPLPDEQNRALHDFIAKTRVVRDE